MVQEKSLDEFAPGARLKILRLNIAGELKKRLLAMGILPGIEVKIVKLAPLGDPVDIAVRGYHLSLRKNEARGIIVEEITA